MKIPLCSGRVMVAALSMFVSLVGAMSPAEPAPPVILIRSGWQTANIGDIAHTPGLLTLLETHAPDAKLLVWGVNLGDGVEEVLRKQFPAVRFLQGPAVKLTDPLDTSVLSPEIRAAFDEADLFLHSSSPAIHTPGDFAAWRQLTGKPYGYYGVTMDHKTRFAQINETPPMSPAVAGLLNDAAFVYFRETRSLRGAREDGVRAPIMEFAPDAVFGVNQYDTRRAEAWMKAEGLEPGNFISVIARVRFAPYYQIYGRAPRQIDLNKEAYNAAHGEADLGKIRAAITRWVRETGLKVALVPEMVFEMRLHQEQILDRLPDDVRPHVVCRRDYWMPDEAAAVYRESIALMSMECHSPIMAVAAGTPVLYLTSETETYKKHMWADVGLGDCMLEIDEVDGDLLAERLLTIRADPAVAREQVRQAQERVRARQAETIGVVLKTALAARSARSTR